MPLHVFEPRYRRLTERCLDERSPFGVVLIREGREVGEAATRLARVGTLAEIRQAGRFPDGRYALLVEGTRRFTVDRVDAEGEPYLVGAVTLLPEAVGDETLSREAARRVLDRFLEYVVIYKTLTSGRRASETGEPDAGPVADPAGTADSGIAAPGEPSAGLDWHEDVVRSIRRLSSPDDPVTVSHLVGGLLQVDLGDRQVLLEEPTAEARLARLGALLDRELQLLGRGLPPYRVDRASSLHRLN
jgi:hypothetical protein